MCVVIHYIFLLFFLFSFTPDFIFERRAQNSTACADKSTKILMAPSLFFRVYLFMFGYLMATRWQKKSTKNRLVWLDSSWRRRLIRSTSNLYEKKRIVDIIHPSRPGFLFFFFFICSQVLLHRTRLPFFSLSTLLLSVVVLYSRFWESRICSSRSLAAMFVVVFFLPPWRCNFYLLNEFDTRNVKVVRGEWMALLFFRSLSLSLSPSL